MKFIHTSDWHLGHQLYNYNRDDEQLYMLKQLKQIVNKEQPDALLISGDIYHNVQPSAMVQKMFSDIILDIHKSCPEMYIIITAGNHDSGSKHEIFQSPWKALNVYMIGHLDKDNPQQHIINVKDKAIVVALPYISNRNLPEGYYKSLLNEVKSNNRDNLPIIMMAHTTVAGVDWTGHEGANNTTVGGIDALSLDDFGSDYSYLALGHIHRPQWVKGGNGRVRYSGSPLPVSFDEAFRHTVSIVDISATEVSPESAGLPRPKGLAMTQMNTESPQHSVPRNDDSVITNESIVTEVEIENIHPLVSLPAQGALAWEEVKDLLRDFKPEYKGTYLRLMVKVEDFLPASANMEAQQLAEKCGCRFCYIHTVREEKEKKETRALSIDEFQRESPEQIAKRYAEDQGIVWDDDMTEMFQEVLSSIHKDEIV